MFLVELSVKVFLRLNLLGSIVFYQIRETPIIVVDERVSLGSNANAHNFKTNDFAKKCIK